MLGGDGMVKGEVIVGREAGWKVEIPGKVRYMSEELMFYHSCIVLHVGEIMQGYVYITVYSVDSGVWYTAQTCWMAE